MDWLALALQSAGLPTIQQQWIAEQNDTAPSAIAPAVVPVIADSAAPAEPALDPEAVDGWQKRNYSNGSSCSKYSGKHPINIIVSIRKYISSFVYL